MAIDTKERIQPRTPEEGRRIDVVKNADYYLSLAVYSPVTPTQPGMTNFGKPVLSQFEAFQPPESSKAFIAAIPSSTEVMKQQTSQSLNPADNMNPQPVSPELAAYAAKIGDSSGGYMANSVAEASAPDSKTPKDTANLDLAAIQAAVNEIFESAVNS